MPITNVNGVSLTLAVWAVDDHYDYEAAKQFDKPYISVTTLMKPLKQLVMSMRVPVEARTEDVEDYVARALGHTIHDGIERSWKNYATNLRKLGYPKSVIDHIHINPTDEERKADPDMIPVFLEQRAYRELDGFVIGGKFDNVMEGHVEDTKSTTVWAWVFGTRDEEYILQGGFYRWIDAAQPMPKITEDWMRVNFVFTDWQKSQARIKADYPQRRTCHKDLKLLTEEEVEAFAREKLAALKAHISTPESKLPRCTDEELWRSEPSYRYYADPTKAKDPNARSSKNFDNLAEANSHLASKGVGVIVTKPGEVKRCPYCAAFDICKQRREYFSDAD